MPASGGQMRLEPVRIEGLSLSARDLAGELYAVAGSGTIYRFVR